MNGTGWILSLVILLGLGWGLVFLTSGLEVALPMVNVLRLRRLRREGDRRARWLYQRMVEWDRLLWVVRMAHTIGLWVVFSVFVFLAMELVFAVEEYDKAGRSIGFGWGWLLGAGVVFAGMIVVYGTAELIPKGWYRTRPTRACLASVKLWRWIERVVGPVTIPWIGLAQWIVGRSRSKELRAKVYPNREVLLNWMHTLARVLPDAERELVQKALQLRKIRVRDIQQRLAPEKAVAWDAPLEVVRWKIRQGYPKWLIAVDGEGRIKGVVNVASVIFAREGEEKSSVKQYVEQAEQVREDLTLEKALRVLLSSGKGIVLVQDAQGRKVGFLELEQILEVIFGDLEL